ncbi:MAG: DnaA/Hda family protein, partial [Pseudomonadota bacterium]
MAHGGFDIQWDRVRGALRQEFGDGQYTNWLHCMRLLKAGQRRVELGVPTSFHRRNVEHRYGSRIRELWQTENPDIESVDIISEDENSAEASPSPVLPVEAEESDEDEGLRAPSERLDFNLVSRFTFDRFIVGPSNEFAYATARRVAEQHTPAMNPLFIHGPSGLGKSHLLQAIGWHIQRTQPKRRVMFLSAEQFMSEFVRAVRHEDIFTFKERFR